MTGDVATWGGIAAAIGLFLGIATFGWRIISSQRAAIDKVKDELHAHKTHVAETYVRKDSIQHMENRIMDAIKALGSRLDRFIEKE